jgi:hypothetical protein
MPGWEQREEGPDTEQDDYRQERRHAGEPPRPKEPHDLHERLDQQPSYLVGQPPQKSLRCFRALAFACLDVRRDTNLFAPAKSHKRLPLLSPPRKPRRRS